MEQYSDGETAAKRPKRADGSNEDLLSALPDDVLITVLLKICDAAVAARTSILSSRWRRLWALLPELHFSHGIDPHRIRLALAAHEAPSLRRLVASVEDASPDSVAAWLPIAARRLSGDLTFRNTDLNLELEMGAFELPCFENATSISLYLGFRGLAMPATGIFARLTNLYLDNFQLHCPYKLGEAVSSPRCPALQKLTVCNSDVCNITIHSETLLQIELGNLLCLCKLTVYSESLMQMKLWRLYYLEQLTVMAPALAELSVCSCCSDDLDPIQLVADISAPRLLVLNWLNVNSPWSLKHGGMTQLQWLGTGPFSVYGHEYTRESNNRILRLLWRFDIMHNLKLTLAYPRINLNDQYNQYLMEDMIRLPDITFLSIAVTANGHSFGACLFHVFRMCTGVRKLALDIPIFFEGSCPSDCICGQPSNWKSDELVLDRLQEVEITNLRVTGHEVAVVKRLLRWATMLERMTVTFDPSVTESMARGFCQKVLTGLSRPEICMKFHIYCRSKKVLYVPDVEGTSLSL